MKTILSLIILCFSSMLLYAQNSWVTVKADQRVTLKFPFEPEKLDRDTYMAFERDSSAFYGLVITDFTELGGDSIMLESLKKKPEFAVGLRDLAMKSIKGAKMGDIKIGNWKGFTSYTTFGTDYQNKTYKMLMLIIGNKMYSFCAGGAPGAITGKVDQFFAGIQESH